MNENGFSKPIQRKLMESETGIDGRREDVTSLTVVVPITGSCLENPHSLLSLLGDIKSELSSLAIAPRILLSHPTLASFPIAEAVLSQVDGVITSSVPESADEVTLDSVIAVVDVSAAVRQLPWQWGLNELRNNDIACCYHTTKSSSHWWLNVANQTIEFISRTVLRTGKSQSRPGITFLKSNILDQLADQKVTIGSTDELIAFCRAERLAVAEARIDKRIATTKMPLTLGQLRADFSSRVRFWWNVIAFPASSSSNKAFATSWNPTQWFVSACILLVASLILFANLGYPFMEPDEARNAQLGLNIYNTGEWMSLSLEGEHYWDKPPLQAWMTAASYRLFGVSEFSARVPCALASIVTILGLLVLGSRLFGFRTASIGAACLLLCSGFTLVSRYLTMDASLCCFATLMFLSILLAIDGKQMRKRWLVLAGVSCGLGLMAKGPVIGAIVLPPIFLLGWLTRNPFCQRPRFWAYLFVPAFAIAAPWYLAMTIVHPDFVKYFFWKHHVVRFTDAFNHQQPWWYYLPVVLILAYPAVFVLPQLLRLVFKTRRQDRMEFGPHFGAMVLYIVWIFGFFSLSDSKLPTYILPTIPAFSLLFGRTIHLGLNHPALFEKTHRKLLAIPKQIATSTVIMLAILAVCTIAIIPIGNTTLILIAVSLLASAAIALFNSRKTTSANAAFAAAAVSSFLFIGISSIVLFPQVSGARSSQFAVQRLSDSPEFRDAPVVYFGRPPRGTFFTLPNSKIFHFDDHRRMSAVEFLTENPKAIIVASKSDVEMLQREMNFAISFNPQVGHRKLFTSHRSTTPFQSLLNEYQTANASEQEANSNNDDHTRKR